MPLILAKAKLMHHYCISQDLIYEGTFTFSITLHNLGLTDVDKVFVLTSVSLIMLVISSNFTI